MSVLRFLASCPIIDILSAVPSLVSSYFCMVALEPLSIGAAAPNIDRCSATAAALNADIQCLVACKDAAEAASMKAVFESVIAILTLVRVRFFP